MKLLSLNVRHGGGKRTAVLCDWITGEEPDVVILPEWRNGASGQFICDRLTELGFEYRVNDNLRPRANGVLVAAKQIIRSLNITPLNSMTGDLMLVELPGRVRILGCYFPGGQFKAPFFRQCIDRALLSQDAPLIIIGDLNTGRNDLDVEGRGTPFHCSDLFQDLTDKAKLVDLWRCQNPDQRDWTWRSSLNGFRIDHAFGNEMFVRQFPEFRCDIDHAPRLSGMTDHSALVLYTRASRNNS